MRAGTRISKIAFMLGLLAVPVFLPVMLPAMAQAQVSLSITIAPPELPVYEQPPLPAPDYVWTPGYWAYGPYGYYWVPGTWVLPPQAGLYWTPGYWEWVRGFYTFHAGYWGPYVGFYGGVNYGFGYYGRGYQGGYWEGGHFRYNAEANRIDEYRRGFAVYRQPVTIIIDNHISFNGGRGLHERPTEDERRYAGMRRFGATQQQREHRQDAIGAAELRASANHGRPPIAATPRPGQFEAPDAVRAQDAPPRRFAPDNGPSPRGDWYRHQPPTEARPHSTETRLPEEPQPNVRPDWSRRDRRPEMRRPENQVQQRPAEQARPAEQHPVVTTPAAPTPAPSPAPIPEQRSAEPPHAEPSHVNVPQPEPVRMQQLEHYPSPAAQPAQEAHPVEMPRPESHPDFRQHNDGNRTQPATRPDERPQPAQTDDHRGERRDDGPHDH